MCTRYLDGVAGRDAARDWSRDGEAASGLRDSSSCFIPAFPGDRSLGQSIPATTADGRLIGTVTIIMSPSYIKAARNKKTIAAAVVTKEKVLYLAPAPLARFGTSAEVGATPSASRQQPAHHFPSQFSSSSID